MAAWIHLLDVYDDLQNTSAMTLDMACSEWQSGLTLLDFTMVQGCQYMQWTSA